jgi:hypothetical protein
MISAGLLGLGAIMALFINPCQTVRRDPAPRSAGVRMKDMRVNPG